MSNLRNISGEEQRALEQRCCIAENWGEVYVAEDFSTDQLWGVRFGGRVEIGSGAKITNSYVANYAIGEGTTIDSVARMECRGRSSFGNGVRVATVNENGGRSVMIYDELRSQTAYVWAMYRHRAELDRVLSQMVTSYAEQRASDMGRVGARCSITAVKLIREVDIRSDVTVEGASKIECATLMPDCYVGADVKLSEAIVADGARVDSGATVERCFIGESAIVASGFSAIDSLIFASSHLENGEAASIFAGPYTVSHHKSTLLIAGIFSFFNAGSASNQSNHLFKSGAVHQAVHPRGCKFASGAYIMSPAREGAFTMVKGAHSRHHDTSAFPYSYLIESAGRSMLMPGANLTSYGTKRDVAKWPERDRRRRRRDVINFEEHNPYIAGAMVRAVNALHSLAEGDDKADEYIWERVVVRRAQLRRGVGLYNKAIAASLGAMLERGGLLREVNVSGDWVDLAGAYMPLSVVNEVLDELESGAIASLGALDRAFLDVAASYDDYAHTWAHAMLTQLMGGEPTAEQIADTIAAARKSGEELERQRINDLHHDQSMETAVGYGCDSSDEAVREADFKAVRGL